MRNRGAKNRFKEIIVNHINNNLKEYLIVIIIFCIGLVFGVIFVNKASEGQVAEISGYINDFLRQLKSDAQINKTELLQNSIVSNIVLSFLLWFVGSTVIGMPIVYAIVAYRGFCLGYTVASIVATLGTVRGIAFTITSVMFQNILFIPCILALAVSGIKLYKSIVKDKRKENIKLSITRHTIFCVFILIILEISAFIEAYISTTLLQICVKYI